MPEQPKLRRELGLRDVTLLSISCIVGARWLAAAAHAGPGSIGLWLLAAVFFVVPLAVAVGTLVRKYPGAGGLYLWTRGDFGPWHGFLCFWVFWMGVAFWFPSAALFYLSSGLDALGLGSDRAVLLAASLAAIWIALGTNLIGLKIGKWTENIGALATWVLAALFLIVSVLVYARRGAATVIDPLPRWNWSTVSFWAAIAYAMSGLEMVGSIAGEVHDPERTVPRAGWIASAGVTAFYVSVTIALLIILPPDRISELNGLTETGRAAADVLGARWLLPLVAILVLASGMGQFGGIGTTLSRLPFAAGVDRLLPAAFAKVHPRWGTPHVSILALGIVASFLLIAIQLGDTLRAAYQALVSLMVIGGFLPYLYIFGSAWKAGKRLAAISGWAITMIAILASLVPTAEVTNVWLFEGKLALGTAAMILSAWLVYRKHAGEMSPITSPSRSRPR